MCARMDSMQQSIEFLYLSEPDMIKAGVLDMKACTKTIEEMFLLAGRGDYIMGGPGGNAHGIMLWYPKESPFESMPKAGPDRRYMVMPSYLGGKYNVTGQKWYGSNMENTSKGLPRSILMFALNDADTGAPLAIMSANLLSAMRTGAVPGVAAKYLRSSRASTIAVIGCGVVNRACTMAIAEGLGDVSRIYLYDIVHEQMDSFARDLNNQISAEFVPCASIEEALKDADVITVATAGNRKAEITKRMLKPGALLTVTGTACLPDEMYLESRIAVDLFSMHLDYLAAGKSHKDGVDSIREWAGTYDMLKLYDQGRILREDIIDLGDVVAGKVKPRQSDEDIILFVAGGLPIEDVAWGSEVYRKALTIGVGTKLELWEKPHWF